MTMKISGEFNIGDIVGRESKVNNEVQEQVLKNNVDHIRQYSNIPTRYQNAEFVSMNEEQETLIKQFKANFNGKNFNQMNDVLIYGSVGTGKTHLTIAMLHKMINANIYCRYVTEHHLLDLYSQKRYDEFDAFKKVKVLVIDEIGKRKLVDWQMIHLEELISYRYNEMLPTIFITNLDTDEFKKFVGDRVADRLRENKVIRILMEGKSLRGR